MTFVTAKIAGFDKSFCYGIFQSFSSSLLIRVALFVRLISKFIKLNELGMGDLLRDYHIVGF